MSTEAPAEFPVGAPVVFTDPVWAEDDPLVLREGVVLAVPVTIDGVVTVPVRAGGIAVLVPPSSIVRVGSA